MFGRIIRSPFSTGSPFNVLSHFKGLSSMWSSVKRQVRRYKSKDMGRYNNGYINITAEAFDEVAGQWHAVFTQDPYYLQIYNNLDNIQTVQFGTVDNPVAIFTADTPYRFVGCTGLQNEDDYEQHENMMFMLREGPLQRCPHCGQVFKLIRLRPEHTEEMQFYQSSFHPIDPTEMTITDNGMNMNIFKLNTHWEPTIREMSMLSWQLFTVNQDDHHRVLTDPAYRLWKFKNADDKMKVWNRAIQRIENSLVPYYPPNKMPVQKRVYENIIEAERAYLILDRYEKKVSRYVVREMLDFENHERREKRMRQRASQRWENHLSYFYGGLTEEEQRYRDYYETDQELDPEDEMIEQHIDQLLVLQDKEMHPKNFDFQEYYSHNAEEDQSSALDKILFRFKYRATEDSLQDYRQRNKRMIQRQALRFTQDPKRKEVFDLVQNALNQVEAENMLLAQKQYYIMAAEEALLLYKDYYEGDKSAQIELAEALYKANPSKFLPIFQNFTTRLQEVDGYVKIPKRQWDEGLGLWNNYRLDLTMYAQTIVPTAQQLRNQAKLKEVLPYDEAQLLQAGILEAKEKAKLQLEQATQKPEQPQQQQQQSNKKPIKQAQKTFKKIE